MYQENDIKQMVRDVLSDLLANQAVASPAKPAAAPAPGIAVEDGFVPDVTAVSTIDEFHVPDPADKQGYLDMKKFTVGRIGVWRAGPRYNTWSMLHFRTTPLRRTRFSPTRTMRL